MAVMFSDGGPDIRWVGNESGPAVPPTGPCCDVPSLPGMSDRKALAQGQPDGTHWVPAEVDVSIRPGWFYHADQDSRVKTVDELLEIYYSSVGNGCNLLLNIPPDRRGRIHEIDCERLIGLRKVLDATFADDLARGKPVTASNTRGPHPRFTPGNLTDGDRGTYWATDDAVRTAELTVELAGVKKLNRIRLEEHIALGQRVESFAVDARTDGTWNEIAAGTTIGPRRILRTATVSADAVRLRITGSRACPTLSTFELYLAPN